MTEPAATPREAVQYWYDAATERREERDRLRAVAARIAQIADTWEQQLPEVIRTPAVVSAIRAALVPAAVPVPPTANRAALRDRIRRAVCESEGFAWDTDMLEPDEYGEVADAVLAVLPDRAAVLAEVADWLKAWRPEFFERWAITEQERYEGGVDDAAAELRRLAAEAPTTTKPDRLCGRTQGVDGQTYPPCARSSGHEEAYCRSADDGAYFLAAGVRQDGAQPTSGLCLHCEHNWHGTGRCDGGSISTITGCRCTGRPS